MATIAVQDATSVVLDITFSSAAAGGDSVPCGITNANFNLDPVIFLVKNADTTNTTVTVDGVAHVVPFGAGKVAAIPVNRGVYPGTLVPVTYSKVTSLTVAAIKI